MEAESQSPSPKKASPTGSRAYVSFLAGSGDYVKGVVGLAKGLRRVKTAYPLVVAVVPDVPESHRRELLSQGCFVREIEPIHPPKSGTHFAMSYYAINYSKLRIWEFIEYKKLIYLDADVQVFENIDGLFDYPDGYLYGVLDCFCDWYHTPQYKIGYCQQCPDKVKWPTEMGPPPAPYFNAGMFVFEPGRSTCNALLDKLKETEPTRLAEQDFLNMFFGSVFKPLPSVYNVMIPLLWRHPDNVEMDRVKVVHYSATGSKPWKYTGDEQDMGRPEVKSWIQRWWEIYNDQTFDQMPDDLSF